MHTRAYPKPLAVQITMPNGRRRSANGRLHRLGALTPEQAAQQGMPQNTVRSTAGFTQQVYNDIVSAAQSGNFISFNPGGCTGQAPSGAKIAALATAGGSIGAKVALTIASGPAAPIVAGIAAAINIFGALFSHHAQAVAREQQVVCAAVPAASDALNAIQQAVQTGTVSPADGIAMLQNLLSQFKSQVSSIIKMDSSHCNAACVWVKQLTAIVAELSSQYDDLAAAQSSTPAALLTNSGGGTASSSSIVPLAIAAGIIGVFLLR